MRQRFRDFFFLFLVAFLFSGVQPAFGVVWQSSPQVSAAWTSATPLDTALQVSVQDYASVGVTVRATSTMTAGTLNFEVSPDGTNWFPISIARTDTVAVESTFPLSVVNKMWQGAIGTAQFFRVRINPVITGSGTANITIQASAAPMGNPSVVTAGSDLAFGQGTPGATTQRVFVGQKATYSAATTAKTATAAGTGPFFSICGSATTTVRVQQIVIGGTVATAAVYGDVQLRKTSTATSSGTPVALTKIPHDSADAASTATNVNFYSALATTGSNVGMVASQGSVFPITGTVAASQANLIFDYSNRQEAEAPVLRGTAQCIEASFGTTTTNAPTLQVQVWWTEE